MTENLQSKGVPHKIKNFVGRKSIVKEQTLSNGIHIITYNRVRSKICSVEIGINLPASVEDSKLIGIRNLLINIMLRNTKNKDAFELSKAIENIGAVISPVVSRDYIGISASVLKDYLPELLTILKDVIFNPSFEGFDEEKSKAIQRAQETSNIWNEVLDLWLFKSLKSAYRYKLVGYPETIKHIEKKDVINLYDKYISGNNITMVVVGDLDNVTDFNKKLLEFDVKMKKKDTPNFTPQNLRFCGEPQSPIEPPLQQNVYVEKRDFDSSAFVLGIDAPKKGDKDHIKWIVLATYLSNKLDDEIRQKRGWAYSAHCMLIGMLTKSFLIIRSDINNAENLDVAIDIAKECLKADNIKNISDEDFTLAKNMVIGNISRANQTASDIATDMLVNYLYKLPLNYTDSLLEKAKNIKKDDITDLSSVVPKLAYSLVQITHKTSKNSKSPQ